MILDGVPIYIVQESFSELHIPFHVVVHTPRTAIPEFVLSFCEEHGTKALFANMEYEVDELRRDIQTCKLAIPKAIRVEFLHDKCIIEPGAIVTKQEKAYAVSFFLYLIIIPSIFMPLLFRFTRRTREIGLQH